jgi:hypothetical protein
MMAGWKRRVKMKNQRSHLLIALSSLLLFSLPACQGTTNSEEPESQQPESNIPVPTPHPSGYTFYIRPDGGTVEQCSGLENAPYPDSGVDQACAWNNPMQALPPGGQPLITGGDTLIIGSGSYMLGYGTPGAESCEYEGSYECFMAAVPSGPDAEHPTRILGEGWDTGCVAAPWRSPIIPAASRITFLPSAVRPTPASGITHPMATGRQWVFMPKIQQM